MQSMQFALGYLLKEISLLVPSLLAVLFALNPGRMNRSSIPCRSCAGSM